MEKNWLTKSSFLFGTEDMYVKYGLQISNSGLPADVLFPELRQRKIGIPQQHGKYDYGAKYYEERYLPFTCVTTKVISRADMREVAYTLSKKTQFRIWNEPDKYYIGRIYQAPTVEQLRNVGNRFPIVFICEPFAYGRTLTESFVNRRYIPSYAGTQATPTYIVIENTGSSNAVTIQITQSIRREN